MSRHDGNGWVACRCGQNHWGRNGAAGLLLVRVAPDGPQVLLQLRAAWTHQGGTWGIPGGARDSHETSTEAALREAHEEAAVDSRQVEVARTVVGVDHGDWKYTYVLASLRPGAAAEGISSQTSESDAMRWVSVDDVAPLPLHPGFAAWWPALAPEARALSPSPTGEA